MKIKSGSTTRALAVLILSVMIISCSNDLSRSAAEEKLKNLNPNLITRHINYRYGPGVRIYENQFRDPRTHAQYEELLDKLKDHGWITYDKKTDTAQFFSQTLYGLWYDVYFTDKLKPYIVRQNAWGVEVVVAKRVFDKVTGIANYDLNTREVEYMSKVTPTELAAVYPLEEHEMQPMKHSRTFRLFDDGWRME